MRHLFCILFVLAGSAGYAHAITQNRGANFSSPIYKCIYTSGLCGGESIARASAANYFNSQGLLVSASNNVGRIDYGEPGSTTVRGFLIETNGATNPVLWNRDLTNVAWTPQMPQSPIPRQA